MTPLFNVADQATWPSIMSIAEVAELHKRTVNAIREACNQQRFIPAPFINRPYRWRRVDVIRHVEGARGTSLRAVSR